MKKILSITLAILIVFATIPCSFIFSSAETMTTATQLISDKTGLGSDKIIYSESFDSITTSPFKTHDGHGGINQVVNGELNVGAECWSLTGLTGESLSDFAISFDFRMETGWGEHQYIFHGWTGWPGNYDSYFNFQYTDGEKLVLSLSNGGTVVTSEQSYYPNINYSIVLTSIGTTASIYVWEKGETAPETPTLTADATNAGTGDFHVRTYDANDFFDNIVVYDTNAISPLTTSEIAEITGENVSDSTLSYENDFLTGTSPVTMHDAYSGTANEVTGGKWHIAGNVASLTGLTKISLTDFVISYEFKPTAQWGEHYFIFHDATGWPGAFYNNSYLYFKYLDGTKLSIALYNGGVQGTTEQEIIPGKTYNIIIKSIGNTASAYIWEKGTTAPTSATVSATAANSLAGDFHIYTYEVDSCIDNIKVYNTTADSIITKSELEQLTKLTLEDSLYINNFNKADSVPVELSSDCDGAYSITNKKWYMSGYTASSTGLLNKSVGNFVYATEMYLSNFWSTNNLFFHKSGSQGNYALSFNPNNGAATGIVNIVIDGETISTDVTFSFDETYQIVLVSVGKTISFYLWQKGTTMPTEPAYTVEAYDVANGDFGFYTWNGNTYLDNLQIYEPVIAQLTTEEIAGVTDIAITDNVLSYSNDFSDGVVPVKMHDAYHGDNNSIVNGEWNITGEYATITGLTGRYFTDFVYSFDMKLGRDVAEFYFGTDSGWPGYNTNKLKFEYAETGMSATLICGANSVTDNMLLDYGYIYYGTDYHVIITNENKLVSVYIWAVGDVAPEAPLLQAELENTVSGDFHFYGWNTDCSIDNIKVYDVYAISHTNVNELAPELRSEFVSGITFGFNYFIKNSDNVIGQGVIISNGISKQTKAVSNTVASNNEIYYEAVATGMDVGSVLEVVGYIIILDDENIEHYVYSNAVEVNTDELGYAEALYGDANNNSAVDILDLVRAKKYSVGQNVEINLNNTEFDGSEGISSIDITMIRKILLVGIDRLIPENVNYVKF